MLKKVSTKSAKKVITLLGKYFSKKLITVGSICRGEKYHSDIDIIVCVINYFIDFTILIIYHILILYIYKKIFL